MKSMKDALPESLHRLSNSLQFEEEGGIVIESVKWESGNIAIEFAFKFNGHDNRAKEVWQVTASGVKAEMIVSEWAETIKIYSSHVLLLEYKDIYTELYINGVAENSDKLFFDLFQSITQLSDKFDDVSKYVLHPHVVKELSSQGHGLFARGPKTILKIYAQCLLKHNVKPIFIGDYEPLPEKASLKLLKIGSSYCIGHTFDFVKIG